MMVGANLETHKVRLADYLARAHKRISDREESYENLEKEIVKVKKVGIGSGKEATKKRKLTVTLKDLKNAMIEVIEAEKMMEFMHRSKSSEELAVEKKIFVLEEKLNKYIILRNRRLKRFEELENKIKNAAQVKALPEPKPVPAEKMLVVRPLKEERKRELERKIVSKDSITDKDSIIEKDKKEIRDRLIQMEQIVARIKKSKKYSGSKIQEIEKRIKNLRL